MEATEKKKVIVYVDGYNFYNGLKENNWKKFYWLDLVNFFQSFISENQELVKVKYFSAIANHEGKKKRQGIFFSANKENKKFELILGNFMDKSIECTSCQNYFNIKEEKKTDVNIATQLIADAIQGNCELSILVSGDSDLTPPIEFIKNYLPKHRIAVFFPPCRKGVHLKSITHSDLSLENYKQRFKSHQLPENIELDSGYKLIKPLKWV
ncbi:MAG: NYN domain-containing protein [Bacteroidota bacterium]